MPEAQHPQVINGVPQDWSPPRKDLQDREQAAGQMREAGQRQRRWRVVHTVLGQLPALDPKVVRGLEPGTPAYDEAVLSHFERVAQARDEERFARITFQVRQTLPELVQ